MDHNLFDNTPIRASVCMVCLCLSASLVIAMLAITSCSKLPGPFKTMAQYIVCLDIFITCLTTVQALLCTLPVLFYVLSELHAVSTLLIHAATLFTALERLFALKLPLNYIALSQRVLAVKVLPVVPWLVLFVTCIVMYTLHCLETNCLEGNYTENDSYHKFEFGTKLLLDVFITVCYVLIVHAIMKDKRKHSWRITRMGLPATHARNAADNHISALVIVLVPSQLVTSATSIFLFYMSSQGDMSTAVMVSSASISYLCLFLLHAVLYNTWFDECRLYVLTMLSPLNAGIRNRAESMRIKVYNIVLISPSDLSHIRRLSSTASQNSKK